MNTKENTYSDTTSSQSTLKGTSKFSKGGKASKSTCTSCAEKYADVVETFDPPLGQSFTYELNHLSARTGVFTLLSLLLFGTVALSITNELETSWTYGLSSEVIDLYLHVLAVVLIVYLACLTALIKAGFLREMNFFDWWHIDSVKKKNQVRHEARNLVLKYPTQSDITCEVDGDSESDYLKAEKHLITKRINNLEYKLNDSPCCTFRETQLLEELETLKSKLETISKSGQ